MRIIRLTGFGTADFETSITDTDSATTPTSVYVYPLEGDVDECIGLLPKPGCGFEPTQAGDRGGALQYAVFGLIVVGDMGNHDPIAMQVCSREFFDS